MSILRIPRAAQSSTTDSKTSQSVVKRTAVFAFRIDPRELQRRTSERNFHSTIEFKHFHRRVETDSRVREQRSFTKPLESVMVRGKACDGEVQPERNDSHKNCG